MLNKSRTQKIIHNNAQRLLGIIGVKPLLCHGRKPNNVLCFGCEPGNYFQCSRCKLLMPWCCGGSDVFPDWCDRCVDDYVQSEGWPE